jgi:hypothetical protein
MIYLQPITFYAIMRPLEDPDRTEIAEHPDGALKAYAEQWQANDALLLMDRDQGWHVDEILMVPPPMTASHRQQNLEREIETLKQEAQTATRRTSTPRPRRQANPTKRNSL